MDNKIAATIGRNIMRMTAEYKKPDGTQGLTMRELADLIGVTDATVCRWMNGVREPKAYALYRMAKLFGCTMESLMKGVT